MVNSIIDGISMKLNEIFGDSYEIYSEARDQGFNEPCFFISLLNSTNTPKLKNRFYREYTFEIRYFPSLSNKKNKEINDINEKLINGLEYISLNESLVRGSKINSEVFSNVLHFFINYNVFVVKDKVKDESIESISIKQIIKR
ncbi:phage tail terminator family protein [Faecalimicrobium sp. JNUCC 81]